MELSPGDYFAIVVSVVAVIFAAIIGFYVMPLYLAQYIIRNNGMSHLSLTQ